MRFTALQKSDPEAFGIIQNELARQRDVIGLIASENIASEAVLEACGSELNNKYAEGYPGKRYYGGCEWVDAAETLAIDRARQLFGAEHVNVQPHSGTQANLAVVFSVLQPGDPILSMNLDHGGHLSHGHKLNFVGKYFHITPYGVEEGSEVLDYDKVQAIANDCKPKLIIAGASAYSRVIDFERFGAIARSVGAFFLADIAHIAGLVAAGEHPSPVPHADFVTTTTHKTLRGPRGGMILCKAAHQKALDSTLFPGSQGGPMMHSIAAKAVCFGEALRPSFKTYARQVRINASELARALQQRGCVIVSGGTDNHLFSVNLSNRNMTGRDAEKLLNACGIIVNKNLIPFDKQPPMKASGIRIGTPLVTSRGMGPAEMHVIAGLIDESLRISAEDAAAQGAMRNRVRDMASKFPIHPVEV